MIYAFDTSTIIHCLRNKSPEAVRRFQNLSPAEGCVPEVVRAELLVGAMKSARPEFNRALFERFIAPFSLVPFGGGDAVEHYALIRCELEEAGQGIGPNALMIAATARAMGAVLVTANVDEFRRVPGLVVTCWSERS